jgi:hypothetical protein
MTGQRPDKKMILKSNESRGFLKRKGDFLGAGNQPVSNVPPLIRYGICRG